MKVVVMIARLLLGIVFVFFGSNGLFHFLPVPPFPPGPVKDFMGVLITTHYVAVVGFFQLLPGLLLLINRYVPLALAFLAPMLVNIFCFHLLIAHGGLFPVPIIVALIWLFLFWQYRAAFASLFQPKVSSSAA